MFIEKELSAPGATGLRFDKYLESDPRAGPGVTTPSVNRKLSVTPGSERSCVSISTLSPTYLTFYRRAVLAVDRLLIALVFVILGRGLLGKPGRGLHRPGPHVRLCLDLWVSVCNKSGYASAKQQGRCQLLCNAAIAIRPLGGKITT